MKALKNILAVLLVLLTATAALCTAALLLAQDRKEQSYIKIYDGAEG